MTSLPMMIFLVILLLPSMPTEGRVSVSWINISDITDYSLKWYNKYQYRNPNGMLKCILIVFLENLTGI
jgi:hypothetical protein